MRPRGGPPGYPRLVPQGFLTCIFGAYMQVGGVSVAWVGGRPVENHENSRADHRWCGCTGVFLPPVVLSRHRIRRLSAARMVVLGCCPLSRQGCRLGVGLASGVGVDGCFGPPL